MTTRDSDIRPSRPPLAGDGGEKIVLYEAMFLQTMMYEKRDRRMPTGYMDYAFGRTPETVDRARTSTHGDRVGGR